MLCAQEKENQRERERVGMRHGCSHKSLRKLHSLVRGHSLRPSFSERVTPVMWILRGISTHSRVLRFCSGHVYLLNS